MSAGVPRVPERLTGNVALAWAAMARTIAQTRQVTESDLLKIEAAAMAWARWRAMENKIAEVGNGNLLAAEITKNASGTLQPSALRTAAAQAFNEFRLLSVDLGVDAPMDLASVDLFGYPDRPGRGKKGRPRYTPTARDRNRVRLLLALGWTNPRIADALEVSAPTLSRYFRVELLEREKMRDRLDARCLELAMEQANTGNIAALRELGKLIDRQDMTLSGGKGAKNAHGKPEAKAPKLGKKQQIAGEARTPPQGWGEVLQ